MPVHEARAPYRPTEILWTGGTKVFGFGTGLGHPYVVSRFNRHVTDPLGEACDEYRIEAVHDAFLSPGRTTERSAGAAGTIETFVPDAPARTHGLTRLTLALDSAHLPREIRGFVGGSLAVDVTYRRVRTGLGIPDNVFGSGFEIPEQRATFERFEARAGSLRKADLRVVLSGSYEGVPMGVELAIADYADHHATTQQQSFAKGAIGTYQPDVAGARAPGEGPSERLGRTCAAFGFRGAASRLVAGDPVAETAGPVVDGVDTVAETIPWNARVSTATASFSTRDTAKCV